MKFEEWAEGQIGERPCPDPDKYYFELYAEVQALRLKLGLAEKNLAAIVRWNRDMTVARYAWNMKDKDKK